MASPVNPAMILQMLQQRQGQPSPPPGTGAAPGMPPGAGGTPGGDPAASDYAQQVASLKGADPGGLQRQLKSMKQILAIMAVQNLERLPNVSGQIFKLIPTFDKVIKEAMQASNTAAAVRNPISMGAAQPPPGMPDTAGGQGSATGGGIPMGGGTAGF